MTKEVKQLVLDGDKPKPRQQRKRKKTSVQKQKLTNAKKATQVAKRKLKHAEKKLKVDELFTHEWKLEQAKEAYELFDKQSDGKGVIYPS